MKVDLKNLPDSPEHLREIIFSLGGQLLTSQNELTTYKEKYARLIEEIRLARWQWFSPSSEKNILQSDFFDGSGIEFKLRAVFGLRDWRSGLPRIRGHILTAAEYLSSICKPVGTSLNKLYLVVEPFGDAIVFSKSSHSDDFAAPKL